MPNSAIWVVVANENDAAICTSRDGTSKLLRVVGRKKASAIAITAQTLAMEIMLELLQGAQDGAYSGVIVMAGQRLMAEINRIAIPQVRKFLVARIIDASPCASLSRALPRLAAGA